MKTFQSLVALCLLFAGASSVYAAEAPKLFASFPALIAEGYEIKSIITTPRNPPDPSAVNVIIALQKGKSVAVCDYHSDVWNNLTGGEAAIDATRRCAVRSY